MNLTIRRAEPVSDQISKSYDDDKLILIEHRNYQTRVELEKRSGKGVGPVSVFYVT